MKVGPVTGQIQYQISELLGPVLLGASFGSYTDPILATSLRPKHKVPQNQRLWCAQKIWARTVPRGTDLPGGYCTSQSQQQQIQQRSLGYFLLLGFFTGFRGDGQLSSLGRGPFQTTGIHCLIGV